MTNSAAEILVNARRLLAKRGGWTQRTEARLSSGEPTLSEDPDATSFCLLGAVYRFMSDTPHAEANRAWGAIKDATGARDSYGIVNWNDRPKRRKREVLAVIDEAIAKVT